MTKNEDLKTSTTDGDAERALDVVYEQCHSDFLRKKCDTIRTALQTRTPPDKCEGDPSTYWSTKQDFVHPAPVDTINIKREVLMGVRESIRRVKVGSGDHCGDGINISVTGVLK